MRLIIHKSIKLKLEVSTMKSLHVSWIIHVYNHIASAAGRDVCIKSSMSDEVAKGRENMLVLDPYINTVHHDVTSTSSSSTDLLPLLGLCTLSKEKILMMMIQSGRMAMDIFSRLLPMIIEEWLLPWIHFMLSVCIAFKKI